MFFHVLSLVFFHVLACSLTFSPSLMFPLVLPCALTFNHVLSCSPAFPHVPSCFPMFPLMLSRIPPHVPPRFSNVPSCSPAYSHVLFRAPHVLTISYIQKVPAPPLLLVLYELMSSLLFFGILDHVVAHRIQEMLAGRAPE